VEILPWWSALAWFVFGTIAGTYCVIRLKRWMHNLIWRRKSGLFVDMCYSAIEELCCAILARYILARRRRGFQGVSSVVQQCIDRAMAPLPRDRPRKLKDIDY